MASGILYRARREMSRLNWPGQGPGLKVSVQALGPRAGPPRQKKRAPGSPAALSDPRGNRSVTGASQVRSRLGAALLQLGPPGETGIAAYAAEVVQGDSETRG